MRFDASGPLAAVREMKRLMTDINTIGAVLLANADAIIVKRIKKDFPKSKAKSNYRQELNQSLYQLDPQFVARRSRKGNYAWAQMSEEDRRGRLTKMGISKKIVNAVDAKLLKEPDAIMAVIGDVDKLNDLSELGSTGYFLWKLLEFGIDPHVKKGKGVQIWYHRNAKEGRIGMETQFPGLEGRHAFLTAAGALYEADNEAVDRVMAYLFDVVTDLSH